MKKSERVAGNVASYIDDRTGAAGWAKKNLTKVFPDHWSFMLGEIALYSFIILLLSGTFLTFWFDPSQQEVIYNGSYAPLSHVSMSASYASTLHISFDVRGELDCSHLVSWKVSWVTHCPMICFLELEFVSLRRSFRHSLSWVHISPTLHLAGHSLATSSFRVSTSFTSYSCPASSLHSSLCI